MNAILAATALTLSASPLMNLLLTLLMVAIVVSFVVWIVTKFAGPPSIPEPFRWIIWVIVAVAMLVFVLWAFGIRI